MSKINIGYLSLGLYLPGCSSLKEKRSRIKPLISRIQREFKISAAELDHQDIWQSSLIGCVLITGDPAIARSSLLKIPRWIEQNWHDIELVDEHIEVFSA
jgi:uncharacterized protein YlxP (DUF503 family)